MRTKVVGLIRCPLIDTAFSTSAPTQALTTIARSCRARHRSFLPGVARSVRVTAAGHGADPVARARDMVGPVVGPEREYPLVDRTPEGLHLVVQGRDLSGALRRLMLEVSLDVP